MIRFRWKRLLIPAVLAGIMFVAPDDSLGQRGGFGGGGGPGGGGGFGGGAPGGGGGGGRGGFNMGAMADSSFDRLVRSYGGSGDSLDYSKIPNDVREQTNMMNQRFGSPPLPSSGSVSRVEFRAEVEKRMASRIPGGAAPTPAPAAPGGGDKVVVLGPGGPSDGKTMTMTMTPGGGGPGGPGGYSGGGFGGGGPGGGFGGRGGGGDQMNPESRFKEMDKSPTDGRLSKEETANGSRRLAGAFEQNDTNKDGFIDLAEYTAYFAAATQGMGGSGGPGGGGSGWGGGGGGWGSREEKKLEEQDEPKPVVYRYGYLPQGLPAYFLDADSDKDGQVGLYEWVKYWDTTEAKLTEFKSLDQNSDGLLTVEEYMRVKKINPQELAAKGAPGRGGAPAWGQPQPPVDGAPVSPGAALEDQSKKDERTRDPRKDEKKEEKKDERRDPRSGGTDPRSGGDTRGSGGFGQRPTGDTRGMTPGGTTPGGRFGSGGGSPFNPGGGTPPGGGRPGGGR